MNMPVKSTSPLAKCLRLGADQCFPKVDRGLRGRNYLNRVCNYCQGKEHCKNECPVLKANNSGGNSKGIFWPSYVT